VEVPTSQGPARVILDSPEHPWFLAALTHGAGGDVDSADLLAVRDAVLNLGGTVARITQPYRVRGARAPGSPERQDQAWIEIISTLRTAAAQIIAPHQAVEVGRANGVGGTSEVGRGDGVGQADGVRGVGGVGRGGADGEVGGPGAGTGGVPLVQGGRSNGARVACRTAEAVGAAAVIALAFPLHPPGRPDRCRADELRVPGRKVLVVNGDRDPFGVPKRGVGRRVVVLPGETHALSRHPEAVAKAVKAWLRQVLSPPRIPPAT
jgi:predicted alpha/beta-hydrolase family hydrolase